MRTSRHGTATWLERWLPPKPCCTFMLTFAQCGLEESAFSLLQTAVWMKSRPTTDIASTDTKTCMQPVISGLTQEMNTKFTLKSVNLKYFEIINMQFLTHRKHTSSPFQITTGWYWLGNNRCLFCKLYEHINKMRTFISVQTHGAVHVEGWPSTFLKRLKRNFFFKLFLQSKQDHEFKTHYLQLLQVGMATNSLRTHNSNS